MPTSTYPLPITAEDRVTLGEPTPLRYARGGDRALTARGWVIAQEDDRTMRCGHSGIARDATRWTTVTIALTTGGRLIVSREHRTRWQGERDRADAHVATSVQDALDWLVADNGGRLGYASRLAWEAACRQLPEVADYATEAVE